MIDQPNNAVNDIKKLLKELFYALIVVSVIAHLFELMLTGSISIFYSISYFTWLGVVSALFIIFIRTEQNKKSDYAWATIIVTLLVLILWFSLPLSLISKMLFTAIAVTLTTLLLRPFSRKEAG